MAYSDSNSINDDSASGSTSSATASPTSSLPPSYSSPSPREIPQAYPQPYPQVPSVTQRKSSTIIPISYHDDDENDIDPDPDAEAEAETEPSVDAASKARLEAFYDSDPSDPSSAHARQTLALPIHMRGQELERTWSSGSSASASAAASVAEEGEAGETTSLLHEGEANKWYQGPLFVTAVKLGVLFFVFTGVVVGTFYFGIPKMDAEDRGLLKLPRSFADLQALNNLFQKYKHRNPYRILACGVVSYLFVQTFSLPGSMYISILFGAAYGIIYGLVLSCLCESIGSVFCYTLSSLLAPPLLALPFYRARVETWRIKIMGDPKKGKQVTWDGVFAFLIVLRIAPFPPHWVANFVAPHLGIGVLLFWASCFIGIAPVSVIHVTIGSSLDSMTSAADFHILSLRNVLGLCAVVVAVLIPVGLKRVFRHDLGDLGEAEGVFEETNVRERELHIPAVGDGTARRYHAIDSGLVLAAPSRGDGIDMRRKLVKGKGRALEIIPDLDEEDEDIARLLEEAIDGENGEMEEGTGSGLGESSTAPSTFLATPPSSARTTSSIISNTRPHSNSNNTSFTDSGRYEPHEDDYEIYDTTGRFNRVKLSQAVGKPYRPNTMKGYGSIQSSQALATAQAQAQAGAGLVVPGPGEREMSAGGWWPFARTGVA